MNQKLSGNTKKAILVFTIALAIIFALVFYKEERLRELFRIVQPDHISVLYLKLLLNIDPENANLRLELARHYINLGDDDKARLELKSLLAKDDPAALDARLMMLEINLRDYFYLAEDDPNRQTELVKLQSSIIEISEKTIPVTLMPRIIRLSLELNQPVIAANLYYQWSTSIFNAAERLDKLQESARWYIAAELPYKAAEVYHESYKLAGNTAQAKQFALLALQVLRAVGGSVRSEEYFHDYQQQFPKDPELLDEMISIYFADNKPRHAYEMGIVRLTLDPDNPDQIKKQIERALAAEEIKSALVLAYRLIGIVPDDHNAHESLARIAEWNDKPAVAFKEWLWLARNRKDDVAILNAAKLSRELYFFNITIEMLEQLASTRELTEEEVSNLLFAYNEAGNLSDHINFLESYLKRYPNNLQAWEALAKTQENTGQIAEAMATWQYIGEYFNRLPEAVAHQARLMWRNGQSEEAFSLLLSSQDEVTEKDSYYWEILGELSWELEQPEYSFLAYNTLWESRNANALVVERLIQMMRDKDRAEETIAIGEEAYTRFNESRWLLLSMDVANQAGMPTELKRLVKIAMNDEAKFEDSEMYWLLRAQLDIHENKPEMVIKHYQQALTVNPASTTAKEGILWSLIERHDRNSLQSYLEMWHTDASENSMLWGVYGIALATIGQYEEALPWLERKSQISPDDYLWQLTYADVLSRAGHADAAWRLRQYVLFNLRSRFNEAGNKSEKSIKDLLHPQYLALVRDMEGADAEVSILKKRLAQGYDDPVVQELLVAAYLSQKNYAAARYWLLQEHIARQETPAWQRLTLALTANDLAAAEHILENENDKLTAFNKMDALKRLNRNEEALALTYDLLDPAKGQTPALQTYFFQARDELAVKSSKQLIGGFDYRSLGDIDFIEGRTRFTAPYLRGTLGMELKYTHLNSSDPNIILPVDSEVDIATEFTHPLREGMLQLNLGGNLRDDKSVVYGAAKVSQDITNSVKTSLRLGVNEISQETGPLRALGRKDIILFNVSTQLTRQTFMSLDIDAHRYLTRERSTLGKGYKLQGILANSLLTGIQDWQIRLQGTWESNDLAGTLPSELTGLFAAPVADVETLITKRFGTMGAGTTFRYGPSDQGVLRRPFFLADAWTGWVWPNNVLGYTGRIGVGISLLGPDILSAGAFYSNIQGGKTDQAFKGIGLQYSIRF
ncbi:tetratricopeptide repeat protein [Nitrosomonas communis]|uniref:tetratricopeptide repeat protein n=1 Tax=Nitrosomonas communis TaxID=44574 RepID=UPI0026F1DAE9|nr:tetratricopeptide repeat protein [Nitrosomonas communis]MCO6426843.1 tetratricopeptide repeat protein [Nitrosomonas communis]